MLGRMFRPLLPRDVLAAAKMRERGTEPRDEPGQIMPRGDAAGGWTFVDDQVWQALCLMQLPVRGEVKS